MKKLICEMCGSSDMVKQDGLFVCQVCGCKYSAEEAKKMMVEGIVEIVGTVKVDKSEDLQKLYVIAKRARKDNNSENAQKYYEQILVKDPESWEANFYAVYYQSMNCKIGEIGRAADRLHNCEISVLKLINTIEDKAEKMSAAKEVSESLIKIAQMLFYGYKNHYDGIASGIRAKYAGEYIYNCKAARDILYDYGNNVVNILGSEYEKDAALPCWKEGVELHRILIRTPNIYINENSQSIIQEYVKKIHKCDSSYKDEKFERLILNIGDGSSSSLYYKEILHELEEFSCYDETAGYVEKCKQFYNNALERENAEKLKRIKEAEEAERQAEKKVAEFQIFKKKALKTAIAAVAAVCVLIFFVTVVVPNAHTYMENSNIYNEAVTLAENGEYYEAIEVFESLEGFKNSEGKIDECKQNLYDTAVSYVEDKNYDEAVEILEYLSDYSDSAEKVKEVKYTIAVDYEEKCEYPKSAAAFRDLDGYEDSFEKYKEIIKRMYLKNSIISSEYHTIGVKSDGTVVAAGKSDNGQCDISDWTGIISVSAGASHTVGLKSDGTVVAVGNNNYGQCNVGNWTDIVAISAGKSTIPAYTVGLKSDGTVVTAGNDNYGQCNVDDWTDIVAVSTGGSHTVGLKSNGTVVAVGSNVYNQCDVKNWTDIIAISAGYSCTVGLKSDGTVVAVGNNNYNQCEVSDWSDIIAVSGGLFHTVGLKSDGTVVAVGSNSLGRCNVNSWTDIIAVSVGDTHTVGLKSDGTVVAVGSDYYGQCDIDNWTGIKVY